ncbi:hypothetical protein FHX49_000580 [Microbacterium endophyticum]|uniref:Folate-binding protein YgfZ n=1 Tax=Microbacterium endophyticum TaxID=1526412 RepID=A0A7W4YM06_9MICO|nr:folate-binding protein YgfZ [Microbacterium endophyticum]MBB2975039.1 hypothetical protein [Microbacterium endophyticum]NIK37421.1 hypothetical protein [Microbacterium endophyticum]
MNELFAGISGAVIDEYGVAHFGAPLREQRSLADGSAVVPLSNRSVLAVAGEDRLTWLDSISSQALSALAPAGSSETLILGPNGHVEYAASVYDDGETAWLIVDDVNAEGLLAWLTRMRFRLRVAPRDASAEYSVVGGTPEALAAVAPTAPTWRDSWPEITPGGHGYAVVESHPGTDYSWAEALLTPDEISELAHRASSNEISLAGYIAADALRLAAWRPRVRDIDDRTLPHEVDWLRTSVHLSKGCYRGQETVAKVHNLGHPPRRMVMLHLDGSDSVLPARNASVFDGETLLGTVWSSALHYEDGPIALAMLKRNSPVEGVVQVETPEGRIAATLETIVPPEAGAAANVPRLPRLSRRAAVR